MILHAAIALLILAVLTFLLSLACAHRSDRDGVNFLVWTRYMVWRERFSVASFGLAVAALLALIGAWWTR